MDEKKVDIDKNKSSTPFPFCWPNVEWLFKKGQNLLVREFCGGVFLSHFNLSVQESLSMKLQSKWVSSSISLLKAHKALGSEEFLSDEKIWRKGRVQIVCMVMNLFIALQYFTLKIKKSIT